MSVFQLKTNKQINLKPTRKPHREITKEFKKKIRIKIKKKEINFTEHIRPTQKQKMEWAKRKIPLR